MENERAPMSDAGLDDDVGGDIVDDLLQPHEILGMLDDRSAEPCEGIRILLIPARLEPQRRDELERLPTVQVQRADLTIVLERETPNLGVDRDPHSVLILPAAMPMSGPTRGPVQSSRLSTHRGASVFSELAPSRPPPAGAKSGTGTRGRYDTCGDRPSAGGS